MGCLLVPVYSLSFITKYHHARLFFPDRMVHYRAAHVGTLNSEYRPLCCTKDSVAVFGIRQESHTFTSSQASHPRIFWISGTVKAPKRAKPNRLRWAYRNAGRDLYSSISPKPSRLYFLFNGPNDSLPPIEIHRRIGIRFNLRRVQFRAIQKNRSTVNPLADRRPPLRIIGPVVNGNHQRPNPAYTIPISSPHEMETDSTPESFPPTLIAIVLLQRFLRW